MNRYEIVRSPHTKWYELIQDIYPQAYLYRLYRNDWLIGTYRTEKEAQKALGQRLMSFPS